MTVDIIKSWFWSEINDTKVILSFIFVLHRKTPLKQKSTLSISMFAVGVDILLPIFFPEITFPVI